MTSSVSWRQVNQFRLRHHYLIDRALPKDLEEMIRSVCGIQAQMIPAAQLQIWARVDGIKPEDVLAALWKSRSLVRTWCMRGTAHLIHAGDFSLYLEAIIKPRIEGHKRWLKKRGMREFGEIAKIYPIVHDFEAISQIIRKALNQGPATREQVADIVEEELGPEARPWVDTGYYIVTKLLAYQGQVCFGPDLDGKTSLVLTDQWLPKQPSVAKESAENKILTKYLHCYGPATQQDFSAWSGLKMTTVKPIWERNSEYFSTVTLNGKQLWILQQDLNILLDAQIKSQPVRLLPHFDVFLLGHKDKSHIVGEAHYKQVFKKAAWIAPVLLYDGRAIGTWKQKRTTKKLTVMVEPFMKLTKSQVKDVEVEVQRLGDYFELTSEVKLVS